MKIINANIQAEIRIEGNSIVVWVKDLPVMRIWVNDHKNTRKTPAKFAVQIATYNIKRSHFGTGFGSLSIPTAREFAMMLGVPQDAFDQVCVDAGWTKELVQEAANGN